MVLGSIVGSDYFGPIAIFDCNLMLCCVAVIPPHCDV